MNSSGEGMLQFPLKVTLSAMSERTRALIEYYITRSKNRYFAIAESVDTSNVIITDYDHPGSAASLATNNWQAGIALVVLAVGDRDIDGAIMVRKPLDSAGLEKAAAAALQQLNEPLEPGSRPEPKPKLIQNADPGGKAQGVNANVTPVATPSYFRTEDASRTASSTLPVDTRIIRYQAKVEQLCGAYRSLEQLSDADSDEHRFDAASCLARLIARLLAKPEPDLKAAHLSLPDADIYLLPTIGKVYTSLSLENKHNVDRVFRSCTPTEINVTKAGESTANDVISRLNQSPHYGFNVQSFCWLGALFFAQGKLPRGLDINTVWKLRHWPNMTRLELIPNCLEIAAAWSEKPAKLSQIVKRVGCEPQHASSFFNAAHAIGLLHNVDEYGR